MPFFPRGSVKLLVVAVAMLVAGSAVAGLASSFLVTATGTRGHDATAGAQIELVPVVGSLASAGVVIAATGLGAELSHAFASLMLVPFEPIYHVLN